MFNPAISGIEIFDLKLQYGGRECVRIKNNSSQVRFVYNTIDHCGALVWDFSGRVRDPNSSAALNGEGVYIGEDLSKQLANANAPGFKRDQTNNVIVDLNVIRTFGAECVDTKERSEQNQIRNNLCVDSGYSFVGSGQSRQSSMINLDGDKNTVSSNALCAQQAKAAAGVSSIAAYGVRTGDAADTTGYAYGKSNSIAKNKVGVGPSAAFFVKQAAQVSVCGNTVAPGVNAYLEPRELIRFQPAQQRLLYPQHFRTRCFCRWCQRTRLMAAFL